MCVCHRDAGRFWWAHWGHDYPRSTILLWMAVVLASPIPGLTNAGWQATQLAHKQLQDTNSSIQANLGCILLRYTNKGTLPCMFHSPTPSEAEIPGTDSQWPYLPKIQTEIEPPGLMWEPLYRIVTLCKQHNSDVMIMTSQSSASSFRWERHLCMHSRVMLTCLHICRHPWPTPICHCMNC